MIKRTIALISVVLYLLSPLHASAQSFISPEQKAMIDGGARFADYANSCNPEATGGAGSSIYVVGDSLTVGMRDSGELQQKLTAKGWAVRGIQATSGDTVTAALPKVQTDLNTYKTTNTQVDTFVVALGTNKEGAFDQKITQMLQTIKGFNLAAKVYWMNAYTNAANYDDINAPISQLATTLSYQVIDWKTEVTSKPSEQYPFAGDGIHHTAEGYKAKADFLVSSTGTPLTVNPGNANQGPATQNLQQFIDTYGQIAFNVGKQFGLPYEAILSQGALESGYGGSRLTREANNFHGLKAGRSWTGPVWRGTTREETPGGGGYTIPSEAFRAYLTPEAGWQGYGEFILQNSRYRPALAHHGDPYRYIQAIKDAGYATDNEYVQSNSRLIAQIEQYIRSKNLFPPSSQVPKDAQPPVSVTPPGSPGTGQPTEAGCPPNGVLPGDTSTTPVDPNSTRAMGQQMAAERGWTGAEFVCLDKLWQKESGWRVEADNPTSTAYGIPQALLSAHKANIDANYQGYYEGTIQQPRGGKADVQIRWGLDYIKTSKHKTPCGAWGHSQRFHWY